MRITRVQPDIEDEPAIFFINAQTYRKSRVLHGKWIKLPFPRLPTLVARLKVIFGAPLPDLAVYDQQGMPDVRDVQDLETLHAVDNVVETWGISEAYAFRDAFGRYPATKGEFASRFLGRHDTRRAFFASLPAVPRHVRTTKVQHRGRPMDYAFVRAPEGGLFVFALRGESLRQKLQVTSSPSKVKNLGDKLSPKG